MNWDQIEGNWKKYRGMVKEQWGRLTDDDLDIIAGKRDQLIGSLQKTYGVIREDAERQLAKFLTAISTKKTGKMSKKGSGKMAPETMSTTTTAQEDSEEEHSDSAYSYGRKAS